LLDGTDERLFDQASELTRPDLHLHRELCERRQDIFDRPA